ncbi:MAG TPA: glycosyl hydrolase family 18 protein [Streptosporangiaceae bacterium]|nr:glycosyl hydrolase family 18 protein [Streptosporangiaceae bacterium]
MFPLSRLAASLTASVLLAGMAAIAPLSAASAATNLITNPGFETGNLSGWSCLSDDSAVTSPVHSGSFALAGAATSSDTAQCSQVVSVAPSSNYTLTAWVEGNYVFLGDSGTGTSDTSNWTPSATSWQQLSTSFTTGASTTSVTVYLHGWYAQGTYYADDVSLTGPAGGGGGSPPGAPTGLAVTGTTQTSVSLSWVAPSGTVTGYNIYQGGAKVASTTGTSFTVSGLSPGTSYTFAVTATNTSGESPQSSSVTATTQSSGGGGSPPGAPTGLTVTGTTSSSVSLSWTAPSGTVTSYNVYENGTLATTSTTTSATVSGLASSTSYSFTVAGVNSVGTGPQSTAVSATTSAPSMVSTPGGVHVTFTGSGSVTLAWNASSDSSGTGDQAVYHVYEGSNIVATSMGTSVTVSDLLPSTSYSFTVQAYDQAGYSSGQSSPVSVTTATAVNPAHRKVAYFDQWSIYGNAYYPQNIASSGAASKLTTVIYDFENIDPNNLTCFETIKAADSSNDNDPNAGDGAGDAYADYQKGYSGNSVDGSSDVWSQPLAGNFNQLRELKAKYPNLKILLSIGGWTYSKYFSDVAATAASRQKFVSSCISMFLQGNLPTGVQGDPHGGAASAAGIFDGFDIDWEYPGSPNGHPGNHYSAADTANYTLLLQEFRNELTAYGQQTGRYYELSAALPSGQDKIDLIQTSKIGQYLDFGDVMTYDMHGAWEKSSNFQAPLHNSPSDPSPVVPPGNEKYNVDTAIKAYTTGLPDYNIPGGFPASKIDLGIPWYWRGWTGVPAGSDHGLYQSASGPSAAFSFSQTAGVADYKELVSAGLAGNSSDNFFDSVTDSSWIYDGSNFYTGETPQSIAAADSYVQSQGLGGVFAFSLDDDSGSTLLNAMTGGLP